MKCKKKPLLYASERAELPFSSASLPCIYVRGREATARRDREMVSTAFMVSLQLKGMLCKDMGCKLQTQITSGLLIPVTLCIYGFVTEW